MYDSVIAYVKIDIPDEKVHYMWLNYTDKIWGRI